MKSVDSTESKDVSSALHSLKVPKGTGGQLSQSRKEGITIPSETFEQFSVFAQFLFQHNPLCLRRVNGDPERQAHLIDCKPCEVLDGRSGEDAEIADVFELIRRFVLGGDKYSPALIKRVTREVTTECGPWI